MCRRYFKRTDVGRFLLTILLVYVFWSLFSSDTKPPSPARNSKAEAPPVSAPVSALVTPAPAPAPAAPSSAGASSLIALLAPRSVSALQAAPAAPPPATSDAAAFAEAAGQGGGDGGGGPATVDGGPLPMPSWNSTQAVTDLGAVLVIGGGRPVGSALVAALQASGVPVWALEDGTRGFVTSVHYDVPLFEFNASAAGVLTELWAKRAPDTVFVDGDPLAPVEPWGAPLACVLTEPRFGLAQLSQRVVFLGDSAGAEAWGGDQGNSGLLPLGLKGLCSGRRPGALPTLAALVTWPEVSALLGPSIDPTRPGAAAQGCPLNSLLLCLVRHAESQAHASHSFDMGRVFALFSGALPTARGAAADARSASEGRYGDPCTTFLAPAAAFALGEGRALTPAIAAASAVAAALQLPPRGAAPPTSPLYHFAARGTASSTSPLLPPPGWPLPTTHFVNGLPKLQEVAAAAGSSEGALLNALAGEAARAPTLAVAEFADTLWWVWRHALLRGYKYPEPLPDYDPSVRVGNPGKYSIHDLCTFGVSHGSGHVKMRHSQAVWGWRFKRGGIPWSSTALDPLVPVKVIEPPEGSQYHLLALRTVAIWQWALAAYPSHAWYIRMWDDVMPLVERYVDIASAHDADSKLAVGRVVGERTQYLSGGPPGMFSRGWGEIMRMGAPLCLETFRAFNQGGGSHAGVLPGRGRESHNFRLSTGLVDTHCGLGCEDLVIEQCLRDTVGGYYELVHWWGFDSLAPSTINEKGLYDCKAFACRRRIIARGDPNDRNPIQSVTYHYVKPPEMLRAEEELYGGPPPGSKEWVDMCEQAQARPDCKDEVIAMPLPEPGLRDGWAIAKDDAGKAYYYNSNTGAVFWVRE